MACGCKGRQASAGQSVTAGTYRVMVNGRQVYESSNGNAAKEVADKFDEKVTRILSPGQSAATAL